MHETSMDQLMNAITDPRGKPKKIKSQMKQIAAHNKEALQEEKDVNRIPNEKELASMRDFGITYKKNNPKASKREIRRAIQTKYNIRIYKSGRLTK